MNEALRLRVKDLDFGFRQIVVRDGKGAIDRFTVLPTVLIEVLQKQTIQDLLAHREISTTMIYTHVLQNKRLGVRSRVDF